MSRHSAILALVGPTTAGLVAWYMGNPDIAWMLVGSWLWTRIALEVIWPAR